MGDNVTDYVKRSVLQEMYASVERMNFHVMNGNTDGVLFEQNLQRNLRSNFEELSDGRIDDPTQ